LRLLHDLRRYPNWKALSPRLVVPTGGVLVPYSGEPFLAESRAELDQCRPQTAMHVRNLALNQLADEDGGTLANPFRSAEDLFPFRISPPAAPDATAGNPLCEIWTRATSGLAGDSVTV